MNDTRVDIRSAQFYARDTLAPVRYLPRYVSSASVAWFQCMMIIVANIRRIP